MLPADPSRQRQLSDRDPLLLWRDLPAGRREGLALVPQSCAEPSCRCHDVILEVHPVADDLVAVAMDGARVTFIAPRATSSPGRVLVAAVDVDTGTITTGEPRPHTEQGAAALAWLRAELAATPDLLACLRRRFHLDKHLPVDPPPWPRFSWRRWRPGDRVCWDQVFPEALPDPLLVGGREVYLREWYCANAGCDCTDVWMSAFELTSADEARRLGTIELDFATATPRELRGETEADGPVLADIWAQLRARPDLATHYRRRRVAVQAAAAEGVRRSRRGAAAAPRPRAPAPAARSEIPRNAPCPCGSGLKYKRCCLGKPPVPGAP
jgi:hypothetical protein